ncbi:hypothetical protein PHMEG_00017261 [Phytophthora megakarya]|uniref:RNA-directed DNA polymerase n=1 Tax=Phytophthora megakarya TaxID=4795 RepID=A0A225VYH6_9STRA|nr:hypothetical protein PHMEG_00017261 [Phytophthora megakarya]
MAEVDRIIASVKNNNVPDIDYEMRSKLRMNLKETDVSERVIQYFKTCHDIIEDNGWSVFFDDDTGRKQLCRILIASLEPQALREDIERTVRFQARKAKEDEVVLHDLILEKALEHDKAFQRHRREKRERGEGDGKSQSSSRPIKSAKKTSFGSGQRTVGVEQPAKPSVDRPKLPPKPCPHCEDMHWLSECTKATDEQKAEIRRKLRAQRGNGNKKDVARLKRLRECIPSEEKTVTLNDVLEVPYCADTGADRTAISRKYVEELQQRDPAIVMTRLDTPVVNVAVAKHEITCTDVVRLRVLLNTAAGPVALHKPVECLVIDDEEPEFIMGQDLLKALGAIWIRTKPPTDKDLRDAIEKMLRAALEQGFPRRLESKLRAIVFKHDVWRLTLGDDPPAKVDPLEIRLKEGAKSIKSKPRQYPPAVRTFMREFNSKLVELGWVYENPTSRWASPVLPVRKAGMSVDEYRQTCDYRLVNDLIEALISTMPHMTSLLECTKGKKHYGLFDMLKGFWQLPLHILSQELMSYITDSKIYTPRRVPQGCCDAAVHFQQTMEKCFEPLLYEFIIVWIDDLLLFADDVDTYVAKLEQFLDLVGKYGFKLSAKKSSLYQPTVKWCGRIISCDGIAHDPERIDTLRAMPYPTTAGQLQQFLCASNWMRESIVDYARAVDPLQQRLDELLSNGKRTKRVASGISVELTTQEKAVFDSTKELLATSATLALPDDKATTCVFTDASDTGYAVVVTQVQDFEAKANVTTQQHKLLTCLSGTFRGAQLNWTVIEKEAYPIVVACDKLDYLLLRARPFRLFCDHRNLIHVFAPHTSVKKHIRGKLLRWALKLMSYRYVIEHVDGTSNVWADMLSRWAGQPKITVRLKRFTRRTAKPKKGTTPPSSTSILRPLDDEGFVWPSLEEIVAMQHKYQAPPGAVKGVDHALRLNNRLWIPKACTALIRRLCVIAHCGAQGHRGEQAMVNHLRSLFHIADVHRVVHAFVSGCLLCPHVKGGRIVRRPWGETIECNDRNGVLHWDFLFVGESFNDDKYLLVLKDHATHFCELVVCDSADSAVATTAILDWHSRFGAPPVWVSDNGSHFKNEVVAELSRRLKSHQIFTIAYSPWINGSVERVNRDVLQVLRAMILDYKISTKDWVYLVPLVQSSINHTAVPSLGNTAPIELFTGLPCPTPLADLRAMHQPVADQRLKQRLLNKKKERGENTVNFDVGDYVLRSRVDEKKGNKLLVTWQGPYKVIRADPHSFRVSHLVSGNELDVHPSRLKFYMDSSLDVTEEILVAAQGIILAISTLKKHRWNSSIKDYEILVGWKGLESVEDSWEPLTSLGKEVKVLVDQYIQKQDAKVRKYWKDTLTKF